MTGKINFAKILILLLGASLLYSQKQNINSKLTYPSLDKTLSETNSNLQTKNLSDTELIHSAMEFSECSPEEEKQILEKYNSIKTRVMKLAETESSEEKLGEQILLLMYENILNQYKRNETTMQAAFLNGTYNCVSASVIFMALAKAANLNTTGQITPNHAFCTLKTENKTIDVETTNPYGFNPGTKKQLPSANNSVKYAVVPARYYRARKEAGDRMFVSLIAKNLCSTYNDKNNFTKAVPLACKRADFLNGASDQEQNAALDDLYLLCSNYAALLSRSGQSRNALDWLDTVFEKRGYNASLLKTYNDIAYNTAAELCNKGQYKTAALILESRKSYLTSANINEIEHMVIATELNEETKPLAADEALIYLKNKLSENTAQIQNPKIQKTIQSLYEYYVQIKVNDEQKNGRYINAAQIARENLKIFPQSSIIKNLSEQALKNHAISVHNNFAESANKKDYEQARKILLEGLFQNPASSILKNDLRTLEQITGPAR